MKKSRRKIRIKKPTIIAITITIIILMILVLLVYLKSKNKEIESSVQPMDIDELVEESNIIEENIEEIENAENNINVSNHNITTNNSGKVNQKKNTIPYYIKVNCEAQVVTVYGKDENENYTVPVKAMVCSTGSATPKSGVYSIPGRWKWGTLFGNVYGQYCIKITGNILFHTVPYLKKGDPASLEYWEYDKLGTAASAGCVRLTVSDVIWIYNNCANGTKVEFYNSSDPGPLGKPSSRKISSNERCRNWDPTDPNPSNPWNTENSQSKNNTSNNETSQVKKTITMPNLIGLSQTQAEQKLSELGLKYNTKLITSLSKDSVFYQNEAAGANKVASEYGTITIKAYKKVKQVETKVNVVNSSGNVNYNNKTIKVIVNGDELNSTFNGSSYLGTSIIYTPSIAIKVYIDNVLIKSENFNFDEFSKKNENTTSIMNVTVNI